MIAQLDKASGILLDRFQHGFPLVPLPFEVAGRAAQISGSEAVLLYQRMVTDGLITRIGAVVAPNAVAASTLAAISVPDGDIERVARIVNNEIGVNHNYEREHAVNLWFVATAPSEVELTETLARISEKAGLMVLDLRLEKPFHLDLGFSLAGDRGPRRRLGAPDVSAVVDHDRRLLGAIEDGIPLVERPYREIGARLGWCEETVLARLGALLEANVIRRFGVVVRHRALGMAANAMAVWDVDDKDADDLGSRLAREPGVTLCYRRRRGDGWPYNLYCMVHGSERAATLRIVERVGRLMNGSARRHSVLFSRRCFKQTGARFSKAVQGT